jgi:hypothetical protein
MSEALIGTTAIVTNDTFVSSNIKEYPMWGLTPLRLGS